jgi:hypothetical protein
VKIIKDVCLLLQARHGTFTADHAATCVQSLVRLLGTVLNYVSLHCMRGDLAFRAADDEIVADEIVADGDVKASLALAVKALIASLDSCCTSATDLFCDAYFECDGASVVDRAAHYGLEWASCSEAALAFVKTHQEAFKLRCDFKYVQMEARQLAQQLDDAEKQQQLSEVRAQQAQAKADKLFTCLQASDLCLKAAEQEASQLREGQALAASACDDLARELEDARSEQNRLHVLAQKADAKAGELSVRLHKQTADMDILKDSMRRAVGAVMKACSEK